MVLKTRAGEVVGDGKPLAASIPQLSEWTGLSESLLYQLANEARLPGCRRIGQKRFLVHVGTFEEWLKSGMGDEVHGDVVGKES